jgi:hypothetical protein
VLSGNLGEASEEDRQRALAQVPGVTVHQDLAAFAEFLLQRERQLRGQGDDLHGWRDG